MTLVKSAYVSKYMNVHIQITTCTCTPVQVTAPGVLLVISSLGIVMLFALGPGEQLMNNV